MDTSLDFFLFNENWQPVAEHCCYSLHSFLKSSNGPNVEISKLSQHVHMNSAPFYPKHKILRFNHDKCDRYFPMYFIYNEVDDALVFLDGTSPMIHELNQSGAIKIDPETVLQYLLFFCFFVQGDEGSFHVVYSLDHPELKNNRDLYDVISPLFELTEISQEQGSWQFLAPVLYGSTYSLALFAVKQNGVIEMIDDERIVDLEEGLHIPKHFPALAKKESYRSKLESRLSRLEYESPAKPEPVKKSRSEPEAATDENTQKVKVIDYHRLKQQREFMSRDHQAKLDVYLNMLEWNEGYLPLHPFKGKVDDIRNLINIYPNLKEFIMDICQEVVFGCRFNGGLIELQHTLLVGPPGIGKTYAVKDIANHLGRPVEIINMANIGEGFRFTGLNSGWQSGKLSDITDRLIRSDSADPIIVLDEFDKISSMKQSPVENAFYTLFDRTAAKTFNDEYFSIDVDCSNITFVVIVNDTSTMSSPILSRLKEIRVAAPNKSDKLSICQRIYRNMLTRKGVVDEYAPVLDSDVVHYILKESKDLRDIEQAIRSAMAAAAERAEMLGLPVSEILNITLFDLVGHARVQSR